MGALMEQVVCALLGWHRLGNSGTGVFRPDAVVKKRLPAEIKSVCISTTGRGKSVVYDWRLLKERDHAGRLAYVFAGHQSTGLGKAKGAAEFLDRLSGRGLILAIVPAWRVRVDAFQCTHSAIRMHRTRSGVRNGYQRPGYRDGYRNLEVAGYFNSGDFEVREVRAELWGREFSARVRISPEGPWNRKPGGLIDFPEPQAEEDEED